MKATQDIITRVRRWSEDGSKAERRLASMILSDLAYVSKAPIADIASRAGVSEPTVTRFARALGCEGIRDFKYHLAQALAVGGNYLNPTPLQREEREERVLAAVCGGAATAIERLRSSVDMETIGLIADHISTARSVLSYGSGGNSSIMATELHNRLFRLGLSVISHSDGQMQRMTASVATPETVVIAFSISGYSPSVVDSMRISRHYGAKTIAVTAPGSALAREAEILLPFSVPEDSNLYKPNSARYAMMAIVDLIAMTTAEAIGPSVLEGLRRIKHSLAAVNVNDPRLPLGD
ncbi:MurR/RpiR family transcriptional regulator [Microvirga sp. KLBC 81]|uniref:MurR/RpiR family transcriptional regulator n=1 Tax=Microvirga sp. KLBC 81 TaxID=1862707 RepID=UPI000D51F7CE|nr:MurR/RpiR family transcriptional regulator [Microvirga sp. KLBC 81]PVE23750.1 MurR/RpiR family transcriptional regulator [Microvirga sp. KLBC 81]